MYKCVFCLIICGKNSKADVKKIIWAWRRNIKMYWTHLNCSHTAWQHLIIYYNICQKLSMYIHVHAQSIWPKNFVILITAYHCHCNIFGLSHTDQDDWSEYSYIKAAFTPQSFTTTWCQHSQRTYREKNTSVELKLLFHHSWIMYSTPPTPGVVPKESTLCTELFHSSFFGPFVLKPDLEW